MPRSGVGVVFSACLEQHSSAEMQENTWARLRESRAHASVRVTQPSPRIFMHICIREYGHARTGPGYDFVHYVYGTALAFLLPGALGTTQFCCSEALPRPASIPSPFVRSQSSQSRAKYVAAIALSSSPVRDRPAVSYL